MKITTALVASLALLLLAVGVWYFSAGDSPFFTQRPDRPEAEAVNSSANVSDEREEEPASAPPSRAELEQNRRDVCARDARAQNCPRDRPHESASSEGSGFRRESGGSRVTAEGFERSRISDPQTSETARCDPNEEFCWRFPAGFPREKAHNIIRFIQAEIRNPQGRQPPPELHRWTFTDTVPNQGASPLVTGGEVFWVENANRRR